MAYDRIFNFSAGPSMLPVSVLEAARDDMLNYQGSGMSVMEMSHRSKVYDEIIKQAEALLREVMGIPQNYKVMFLQGGASLQFAMVPMNLLKTGKADYIVTGQFSGKAYQEAQKYGEINLAATTKPENFSRIPQQNELKLNPDADYVHICYNNTIFGTKWNYIPETGNVPLVADLSSCILSEPIDVSRFGLIYAGAQKNVAPAGLTIVIAREDLLREELPAFVPTMCNYSVMAQNESMYNTPPCYPIYVCKLVLDWIKGMGGLSAMQAHNQKKAAILYDYLDSSKLFKNPVSPESRSLMNVTFRAEDDEINARFVKETSANGMSNLKGHRSVGGMRASIYNAMPVEGVEKLVEFMKAFEK
ncbi:3-phosphoserine/phosphohydroxythreonine transaminase [Eubacteriales bacterium OttesenSCG-928-K08]|nr:3-phosphoserine/phosphohydroxythreonine transaminase [Eubacteriales bacterium OttesenSCG-928-K08]